jgi:hypothetical protein
MLLLLRDPPVSVRFKDWRNESSAPKGGSLPLHPVMKDAD